MRKLTALLYIFIFILTSCEEEVDYDDLGVKNIIVINGKFVDGETPWCQVSRSDIIFEQINDRIAPTTFLPDANVTVSEGNSDYKYIVVADKAEMEAKSLVAKAGATYTLKAQADGLDEVYSTVKVPSKPQAELRFVSVETETDEFNGPYESLGAKYKVVYELNIQDDPNTEDYYQIFLYTNTKRYIYEYGVIDTTYDGTSPQEVYGYYVIDSLMDYNESFYQLHSNDPVMNWNQTQSDYGIFENHEENERNIFNDQLFNGQTSKIRFFMYLYSNDSFENFNKDEPIYYELRHINKEMYMYYRTFKLVRNNDWTGSLSPYMLYCNVENGAGLVAAWSSVKKQLEIPDISK